MMVPVTLVTGFLGAGKTTLVNHALAAAPDRRIGVLVNDFGEVNIDSRLIVGAAGDVLSLANGCICCSMKNDVIQAVFQVLEHERRPDHLLVEASGVSNPGALAETFLDLQKSGVLRLDGIAAVVDAERFPWDRMKSEALARDQVLAADVVVLNKTDLVDEPHIERVVGAIRQRLPAARLVRTTRGRVPPDLLLGIGGSSADLPHPHTMAHGFQSFVFEGERFHFKRLADAIRAFPPSVVRIKGIISVIERPGDRLALHAVGKRVHVETIGAGEERSQIVVIGTREGFDEEALRADLAACLVTA